MTPTPQLRPPLPHRLRWTIGVSAVAGVVALSGCTGGGGSGPPEDPPVTAAILEPADNTSGVVTAPEIIFSTEQAAEVTVELTELDGGQVDGALAPDGASWLPASQLGYETTYVATLTAVSDEGDNAIATSTFTTMPEPEQTIRVYSFLPPDGTIGVGMPLRIEFRDDDDSLREIPEEHQAEIERRMTVRSDPPQVGSWHWVSDREVHYRPKEYWEPGTQITYRVAAGGLPVGDGWYLRNDLNVNVSVGQEVIMEVDNAVGQLSVRVDGEVARTIPVSLGRPEYPSSSGTFVIMEKFTETVFDTRDTLGDDGYVVDIEFAMRLTYQGEFMHADVRDGTALGTDNVTHGCMNMERGNAEWLFDLTHRWGDPVTVTGTSRQATLGDGWTDWNLDWEEYQRGSALHQG